jgi:hypothetical protein
VTTYYGAADLPVLLADFGVDVSIQSVTVKGLTDRAGGESFPGEQAQAFGASLVVTIETGSLPGLAAGEAIVVDGVTRTVRHHEPIDDGAWTRIFCI